MPDRAISLAELPSPADAPAAAGGAQILRGIFRQYRLRILATYALFNLENALRLCQPLALGWAINDLLRGSYGGLGWLAVQHTLFMGAGLARRTYDTRTFTRIYTDLATRLVMDQRLADAEVSRVAARSAMSREYVDFFERHVPMLIRAAYSLLGAAVMLAWFDPVLTLLCLALLAPALALNLIYGRRTLRLSGKLHDEFEREVEVIDGRREEDVRAHYARVARWRVRLSDAEALHVGLLELFVLGLMAAALVRACTLPEVAAGDIFAIFRFVLMFVMALDSAPSLVQHVSRLRDIAGRMPGRMFREQAKPPPAG